MPTTRAQCRRSAPGISTPSARARQSAHERGKIAPQRAPGFHERTCTLTAARYTAATPPPIPHPAARSRQHPPRPPEHPRPAHARRQAGTHPGTVRHAPRAGQGGHPSQSRATARRGRATRPASRPSAAVRSRSPHRPRAQRSAAPVRPRPPAARTHRRAASARPRPRRRAAARPTPPDGAPRGAAPGQPRHHPSPGVRARGTREGTPVRIRREARPALEVEVTRGRISSGGHRRKPCRLNG